MKENNKFRDNASSQTFQEGSIMKQSSSAESNEIHGYYNVECYDAEGNLKWSDNVPNVITDHRPPAQATTGNQLCQQ